MDDNTETIKIVLLGETGVGKTCLISRYVNNAFQEGEISTMGASYAGKEIFFEEYSKTLKFEIWDTAGQEKYRSVTKIFYKDATAAILVYDITRKESFIEIKKYWYNQLKEYAPGNIIIAIAANKIDLYELEEVPEAEGREFAKSIGAIFKTTSAMDSLGVEDIFRGVGGVFLDPKYDIEQKLQRRKTIKISKVKSVEKKKKCC